MPSKNIGTKYQVSFGGGGGGDGVMASKLMAVENLISMMPKILGPILRDGLATFYLKKQLPLSGFAFSLICWLLLPEQHARH